jgi:hypothetical protein
MTTRIIPHMTAEEIDRTVAAHLDAVARRLFGKTWHFDPSQPRDARGRWVSRGDQDGPQRGLARRLHPSNLVAQAPTARDLQAARRRAFDSIRDKWPETAVGARDTTTNLGQVELTVRNEKDRKRQMRLVTELSAYLAAVAVFQNRWDALKAQGKDPDAIGENYLERPRMPEWMLQAGLRGPDAPSPGGMTTCWRRLVKDVAKIAKDNPLLDEADLSNVILQVAQDELGVVKLP